MAWHLERERDGAGDSGPMLVQYGYTNNELETHTPKDLSDLKVGFCVRVGSLTARSYSSQDYWTTTYITEILEDHSMDKDPWVKFKTGNSIYTLRG